MARPYAATRQPDASAGRFAALLEAIDAVVWEGDPVTWQCHYVSPGAERMLGYPIAAWTDDPQFWLKIMPLEDQDRTTAEITRQAALGPRQQLEFRVRHADGRLLWVRNSMRTEAGRDGAPATIRGVMVDITSMKDTQHHLEESRERLSSVFDAVSEGLMLFRRDGTLVDLNLAAERIVGQSRDQLGVESRVAPGFTLVDESGAQMPVEAMPATISFRTGEPVRGAIMGVVRPDESVRWLEVSTGPIADHAGVVQHVVVSITDVTGKRATEAERTMLWRAVEAASTAMGILRSDGTFEYVNPAFAGQTGYTLAELQGRHASMLADPDSEDADRLARLRALGSGATWRGELLNVHKDGRKFWIDLCVTPVFEQGGAVHQYVFVAEDITRRRSLEAQLRQAQKLESVGRLAGGVAHDFNNLLTAIINYSSFAAEALHDDDPILDDVKEVLAAGRRAASLTSQLLAFARKQIVEPRLVDVNDTIMQLDKMLRRLLGSDIELVTVPAQGLGLAWIDPGQLEQVIVNMAVNARDAMPEGGRLVIETAIAQKRLEQKDLAMVQITISDSGVGMAPEVLDQLFEPFFTTKDPGKGTGLGLATCYGIVTQADGSIEVTSTPGVGTEFSVFLPVAAAADLEVTEMGAPAVLPRGRETILVVDDEPLVRNLASRVLIRAGYHVIVAAGADEALEAMGKQHVDLLVTDIVMPRTNGRILASAFLAQRPGARVLYMSGYADDSTLRDEIASGEAAFLQKPFMAVDLATRVREVLDVA
jgi:PAS domain S-box-containing protein